MTLEFQLPEIGEGVVEGEIVEWHVTKGDRVIIDTVLLSVLTDKATVEIAAPFTGEILTTYGCPGDVVAVGGTLLTYSEQGTPQPTTPDPPKHKSNGEEQGSLISFPLPEIGEGVIEGEVVKWHVHPGDCVLHDQPLLSLLTDKATIEITAPIDGVVVKLVGDVGDTLTVGEVFLVLRSKDDAQTGSSASPSQVTAATPVLARPAPVAAVTHANNPSISAFGTPLATPVVRRRAGQLGVDLSSIVGSGPNHRILLSDVECSTTASVSPPRPPAKEQPVPTAVPPSAGDRRERIKGLRKAIYTSMTRSKSTIPHFTYVDEVEMDKLVALRSALKDVASAEGTKLSYLPFIVKAVVCALRKFPILNASVDDAASEIVFKANYNIGIAVATPAGLTVPVVKAADKKSIITLSTEIADLSDRARNKRSTLDDITGGTFTISSLGRLGGLMATPIINHPEVGILGIHNIEDRAVVRQGQITIRKMMNLSVSFDHRVVDGDVGASFTQEVKSYLEEPGKMLLLLV